MIAILALALSMGALSANARDHAAARPAWVQFNARWGVVFPAERARDLMMGGGSEVEATWTPTVADIAVIEPLLAARFGRAANSVDKSGHALPTQPGDFYRQYGGIVEKGQRLIVVNGFHKTYVEEAIRGRAPADFWRHDVVAVKDGGCWFFHAMFDVAARRVLTLACQGNA